MAVASAAGSFAVLDANPLAIEYAGGAIAGGIFGTGALAFVDDAVAQEKRDLGYPL